MPLTQTPAMTEPKRAAQRSNARRSTGPRTPEGKQKSRINALKHGAYAADAAWSDATLSALGERPGALRELVARLKASGGPASDPFWDLAAEELARQIWRRRRLERAWESLALRHGQTGEPIPLVTLTEEGRELERQLEAADRAVDHKTRLLLRLRENEARHRRELEASARRRMRQITEEPMANPDVPPSEELALQHAELLHRQEETARLERLAVALADAFGISLSPLQNEERSHDVVEKKETGVRTQETESSTEEANVRKEAAGDGMKLEI